MGNASKALLMAAGVLIAIIIISAIVYVYSSISEIGKEREHAIEAEQMVEFNKLYLSYEGRRIRGNEVVSIVNRAKDYNSTRENDREKIKIRIITNTGVTYSQDNYNPDKGNELAEKIFVCTSFEFNDNTGRINGITIEEQ